MASRARFSPLLAPGLAGIFYKTLKDRSTEYEAILPTKKSKRAWEEEYKIAGLGKMTKKTEHGTYTFSEPIPGDVIRYTHETWGLGFRVSQEAKEDDLYGIMNRLSQELARMARVNREIQAHSVYNNAFSSSFTGFDGVALCHNAHPLLGGSTLDNLLTGAFSLPLLQSALEIFDSWTDDRDIPAMVEAKRVIHNRGDLWSVGEVLESEYRPTDADNAVNIVRSKFNLTPHLSHWLTDSDSWFVTASKAHIDDVMGGRMWIRIADQFRSDDDPFTGDALFFSRHRLSTGHGDFRWVVGSAGA